MTIDATGLSEAEINNLRILHCTDGKCATSDCSPPIPIQRDAINPNIVTVCGCTDSFSEFSVVFPNDFDGDEIFDIQDNCPEFYDPSNACEGCGMDVDVDGDLDGLDIYELANSLGSVVDDANYNPDADFNHDENIGSPELEVSGVGFGKTECPPISD